MREKHSAWERFSGFLHRADIVPVVLIVSVYHYFEALKSHDPWLVAAGVAIGVDLAHYRLVSELVRTGRRRWLLPALVTVALVFGLQFSFYSQGDTLMLWEQLMFASIVPAVISFLAWLHESRELDGDRSLANRVRAELDAVIAELRERLETAVSGQKAAESRIEVLESDLKARETAVQQLNSLKSDLKARETAVQRLEIRVQQAESRVRELESQARIAKALNPLAQDIGRLLAGADMSQKEIAQRHGVSESHVSKLKAALNGVQV